METLNTPPPGYTTTPPTEEGWYRVWNPAIDKYTVLFFCFRDGDLAYYSVGVDGLDFYDFEYWFFGPKVEF